MPKSRSQKSAALADLTRAFKDSKSAMFADYQGMKVSGLTDLRKKLTGAKVEYIVAKKSLLTLAAKEAGLSVNFKEYPGMVGVAFALEEEMAGAKLIGDAGKTQPIKLVGGIFEGKAVDASFAIALSKLPSKKDLLAQLLSVFNGPTSAFVRLLNAKSEKTEGAAVTA